MYFLSQFNYFVVGRQFWLGKVVNMVRQRWRWVTPGRRVQSLFTRWGWKSCVTTTWAIVVIFKSLVGLFCPSIWLFRMRLAARTRAVPVLGVVLVAFAITSGRLVVTIPMIMSITRAASWAHVWRICGHDFLRLGFRSIPMVQLVFDSPNGSNFHTYKISTKFLPIRLTEKTVALWWLSSWLNKVLHWVAGHFFSAASFPWFTSLHSHFTAASSLHCLHRGKSKV